MTSKTLHQMTYNVVTFYPANVIKLHNARVINKESLSSKQIRSYEKLSDKDIETIISLNTKLKSVPAKLRKIN